MAWNSHFMKKLIGFNIGMFAWAYYINSQTFGENLRAAPGRSNPLEVNWTFSRDSYIQWLCSSWLVFTVLTWNKYFLTPVSGEYFTASDLLKILCLSVICSVVVRFLLNDWHAGMERKVFQSGKIHWRRNHQRASSASLWLGGRSLEPRPGPWGGEAESRAELERAAWRAAPVQSVTRVARPGWMKREVTL